MSPQKCRNDYLLRHIDATVEFLLPFAHDYSEVQKETCRAQLCNTVAAVLSCEDIIAYLTEGPYDDSVVVRDNMGRSDTIGMLAAAAAVGNQPALLFFVNKVRSAATYSELYGSPLLAAAVNGQVQAAAFIFEHLSPSDDVRQHLWRTIDTCMQQRRTAMLPTLLGWYYSFRAPIEIIRARKLHCRAWAIRTGNLEVLQMCDVPAKPINRHHVWANCRPAYSDFLWACKCGHAAVIQYLLDKPGMRKCMHRPDHDWRTIALQITAKHGWLVAAKMLLDKGAAVNDPVAAEDEDKMTPLECAVRGKHVDMVVLLLAHGARVPLNDLGPASVRNGRVFSASTHLAAEEQGGDMARIIRMAVLEQLRRARGRT